MKRMFGLFTMVFVLLCMSFFALSQYVQAEPVASMTDYQRTSNIYDKTIYRFDDRIVVNDLINGDLYCMGKSIVIDAVINDDVLCAGSTVIIRGTIEGSVRVVAQSITVSGSIGANATLVASDVTIEKSARIGNDVSIVANTATINGTIGRDLTARSDTITIAGTINRALESYHHTMNVESSATIGTIAYSSPNDIMFNNGASYGQITKIDTNTPSFMSSFASGTVFLAALLYIAWFISLIITALGIAFLFPKSLDDSAEYAKKQPFVTGFAGLLTLIITPLTLLLLVVSVVGFPLAVIIGCMFGAVVLLSTPFVAHLIGSELFPQRSHPIRSLVGAVLLLLLYAIPVINIVTIGIVTVYGTGLVVRVLVQRYGIAATDYKNAKVQ